MMDTEMESTNQVMPRTSGTGGAGREPQEELALPTL